MNKKRQLLSIAVLTLSTIILLIIIYARHYESTKTPAEPDSGQEQSTDSTEDETGNEDTNIPENQESLENQENQLVEPEVKPLEFVPSDESYFDDAIIIGDSRTVGIFEYGDLGNITFFASEGMSIYDIWKEAVPIKGMGSNHLEPLLKAKDYTKIYIMLGINELGYDRNQTVQKYKETLDRLHEIKPDAIIYICSNLHVTAAQAAKDDTFNNKNIDLFNEEIKKFADHETYFYLDVNQKFNDGAGNLGSEYTSDNVHILAKYYAEWAEWFRQNTIVKPVDELQGGE